MRCRENCSAVTVGTVTPMNRKNALSGLARRFVIDAYRSAHERNGGYVAPEMQRDTCDGIELSENY